MKYGIWKINEPDRDGLAALKGAGYPGLTARILASRGIRSAKEAHALLDCCCELPSPYLMADMDLAAARVGLAISKNQKIAVFGDYDVDGITATCLLTGFLRSCGADCISYIPCRLEEGYGLNPIALRYLAEQGVQLVITVDCGITAIEEAVLCRELGMDLVITDHHECKDQLPPAAAVVDPHRPDDEYPNKNLSGVAVAFKLACALSGDPEKVLDEYSDFVCMGTVADVMTLVDENRVFVSRGLKLLSHTKRPGLQALMQESNCDPNELSASSIGFVLAPRINAAGRMGQADLAVELLMTDDAACAERLARELCELNRQRQAIESDIYNQAITMLPENTIPDAIVLADENWHQGVVGIVASRLAEEYACPVFLVCLDGEHGKASSRSYGGFNLFASLTALSSLLESYGGHELAAGFTVARDMIPEFRRQVSEMARAYYEGQTLRTSLDIDCAVNPEHMTLEEFDALNVLEPCGNGCPKPIVMMEEMIIDRMSLVGSGKHLRLRLRKNRAAFNGIFFSASSEAASVALGDTVDVAFYPQINTFMGTRSVQLNVVDIRPHCAAPCGTETRNYTDLLVGRLSPEGAARLIPNRSTLAMVWRSLGAIPGDEIRETPVCLCRKVVRHTGQPLELEQLMTCLDIFRDVGLLALQRSRRTVTIRLIPVTGKADLMQSATMQLLLSRKES